MSTVLEHVKEHLYLRQEYLTRGWGAPVSASIPVTGKRECK